jgi:hypothetical protein
MTMPASETVSKRARRSSQWKCIKIGDYYVGQRPSGGYWIEHESGEGMQTGRELEEAIREFYAKHF